MRRLLWVSLVGLEADQGGGGTYSRSLLKMIYRTGDKVVHLSVLPSNVWARKIKLATAVLLSLVLPFPAKMLYCFSPLTILRLLAFKPDAVVLDHVETFYLSAFLTKAQKVVGVLHNVEWHVMYSRARTKSGAQRAFLKREAARMRRYELGSTAKINDAICISHQDLRYFSRRKLPTHIIVVPPTFSYRCEMSNHYCSSCVAEATERTIDPLKIGFVGNLEWWPNRDGLIWFLEKIMPSLSGVQLHVYGRGSSEFSRYSNSNILVHGFVGSPLELWNSFDVLIIPLFSGSGVSVKAAEGLYNQKRIISTSLGLRGLDLAGTEATVAFGANDWVEKIMALRHEKGKPVTSVGQRPFCTVKYKAALTSSMPF